MVLKLVVCGRADGKETPCEHLFSQEYITIGRGDANHLTLSDASVAVREKHVFVRKFDGSCRVLSCGFEEETSINDDPLPALQPRDLHNGDVLGIGSFQVGVQFLADSDVDATSGSETETANSFEDPVDRLVFAFESLAATYEEIEPQQRVDGLTQALQAARNPLQANDVLQVAVDQLLGGSEKEMKEAVETDPKPDGPFVAGGKEWSVLQAVTDAFATALEVPYQFRHELIGHSLSHPSDARFLYEGEGGVIRSTLLDSSLSETEREKRFQYVEEAAEALVHHQIAVMEGYKASVMKGVEQLLTQLDPDAHRDDLVEENKLFGYIPILAQSAILQRVREECDDLLQEDWSVAEQRIFRPAFRKAYLARMDPPHTSNENGD